ncbi:MAG: hypothetical protein ACRCYV_03510 [Aeromonas sp.]
MRDELEAINWRVQSISRSDSYSHLVDKYCSTKKDPGGQVVFKTVKEFMVFAALIAYQMDAFKPLDDKINSTGVALDTFSTTDHDAYVYMLALTKKPTLDMLKDESLREAIAIFEGYCNAGLEVINQWDLDNIGMHGPIDMFFNKTLEYLIDHE